MTTTAAGAVIRHRLPFSVWILAAGTFLMGTTELIVAGLLPQIAGDLHVSIAQTGLLVSVFALGMTVGAPVLAIATLRLPRRVTLMLALVLFAAAHVLIATSDSFTVIVIARFITAVATGAFWSVAAVVATRLAHPSISARALAAAFGGGTLANVIGAPLGSSIGQLLGWRPTFVGVAVLALAVCGLVALVIPADRPEHQKVHLRQELTALRSGRLWLVLLVCAGVNGGVLSIYSYLAPLILDRTRLPAPFVAVSLAVFGVGALIGALTAARYSDRDPWRITLIATTATLALMLLLLPLSVLPIPTLALLALLGAFGFLGNPALVAVTIRFGGDAPNLASAICTSAFNLGTAVCTAIAAGTYATGGPTGPIWVGTITFALLLAPLLLLIRRASRQSQVGASSRTA